MKFGQGSVFDEEEITGIDCSNQDVSGIVCRDCTFVDCNFENAKLSKAQLSDCLFKGCNFSNVKLYDAKLSGVDFVDCKLAGVDFTHCNQLLFSINIKHSKAAYCNFLGLEMAGIQLTGSELTECVFEGTNLTRADLSQSNLRGALFERTNLESADLRGALHYQIDPQLCRVRKARFSYPEALSLLKGFGVIID